jgi:hypothetical protein
LRIASQAQRHDASVPFTISDQIALALVNRFPTVEDPAYLLKHDRARALLALAHFVNVRTSADSLLESVEVSTDGDNLCQKRDTVH